ncbi:hypothetical protein ABIE56_001809 [Luteibacter sp. 621]|uniref:hypothetical protein n=1 Tax=Luteibacter sp. 621 TaxID=3373916 RepID=UPI003D21EC19
MSHAESNRRVFFFGWFLAIAMLWLAFRGSQRHADFLVTDLAAWQGDWQGLIGCLTRASAAVPCFGQVSKFPLAYLINSLMLGVSPGRAQLLLTLVNGFALVLPIVVLALTQGLSVVRHVGWPYLLALALSPLPMFYVASGALEVQAGVFCGIYLGGLARILTSSHLDAGKRTAWVVAIAGLVFPLYKDTAAVLVGFGVLVTLAWHANGLREVASTPVGRARLWRCGLLFTGPVLLGQLLDLSYCWVKFGVPLPLAYMNEAAEAGPSYARSAEFLAGSLLSPNGGVLIFWCFPLFIAIAGWRVAGFIPRRTVVFLAITSAAVFLVALSRWWTPFGWDGWGNRLMIPVMVATLAAFPFAMRPRQLATEPMLSRRVCLTCAPLVAASFYYVALPYTQSQARSLRDSLRPGMHCMRMSDFQATPQPLAFWRSDIYYSCARERMLYIPWRHSRVR